MPDYGTPITIRHLVHHTSGIRDYLTLMDLTGARDDDFYADDEVVALLARQRALNFTPGEEHLYSNSGYFLLSVIVKRATGKALSACARDGIFTPLPKDPMRATDTDVFRVDRRTLRFARDAQGRVTGFAREHP